MRRKEIQIDCNNRRTIQEHSLLSLDWVTKEPNLVKLPCIRSANFGSFFPPKLVKDSDFATSVVILWKD